MIIISKYHGLIDVYDDDDIALALGVEPWAIIMLRIVFFVLRMINFHGPFPNFYSRQNLPQVLDFYQGASAGVHRRS